MKYEIDLYRSESRTVTVEANSPDEAVQKCKKEHPGWQYETANEMDGENVVATHDIAGTCENCAATVFFGDDHGSDGTVYLCKKCHDEQSDAQPQKPLAP